MKKEEIEEIIKHYIKDNLKIECKEKNCETGGKDIYILLKLDNEEISWTYCGYFKS